VNPIAPVLIGARLGSGVSVGSAAVRLRLVGADVAGERLNGSTVFFANVAADTDAEAAPSSTGAELDVTLRSPRSPQELRYAVSLPRGASLVSTSSGAVRVVRNHAVLGQILPPVAMDAQGSAVPVSMRVVGSSVVLEVLHRDRAFAYPILVDPEVQVALTQSSGSWSEFGPLFPQDQGLYGVGNPFQITATAGTYYGNDTADWVWNASSPVSYDSSSVFTWTLYGVDIELNDPAGVLDYAAISLSPAYQSTIGVVVPGEAAVIDNQITVSTENGGGSGQETPQLSNAIVNGGGTATGNAVSSFNGFLFTSTYSCASSCAPDGGPITPPETYGGINPSEDVNPCNLTAWPVNCSTGDFWHTFTDTAVPGRGLPLDLTRTYNSLDAATAGPFGYGWSSSYTMHMTSDSSGDMTVHQENGSTVTFEPVGGSPSYLSQARRRPAGSRPSARPAAAHALAANYYTAAPRVIAALVQNADGTYTFTRRARETFVFSAAGRLLSESDLNGNVTTLAYNGSGQLTSVTDPSGRQLTFSYGTNGDVSQVTDPGGRTVSYGYDAAGNLTSVTDVGGGVTTFSYDGGHLLSAMTDPRGKTVSNTYNTGGQETAQTDPLGRTTQFSYSGSQTTITDPNGNVTVENYTNGELASVTRASGTSDAATWTYTYDPASAEVTAATDPDGHTTQYSYDGSGNLLWRTDPLGRTITYAYNGLNEPTSITDPTGETTTIAYDADGNETSISRPLSSTGQTQTTSFSYGDRSNPGLVTAVTDPDGNTASYGYDSHGDITSVTDAAGNETTYTYNVLGERTAMTTPRGNVAGGNPSQFTTDYTYDAYGDLTGTTDPLGHTTTATYDPDGNLATATDGGGHTTGYSYDADNELTAVTRADGTTLGYSYDPDGNLTGQTDGKGNTTSYAYDPLNRITSVTDPLNRQTTYAYDASGNETQKTDPQGRTTSYGYDADNELTSIVYSDGQTANVSYSYDNDGRRTAMSDGTGTTSYSYDSLGRLTSTTNGAGNTIDYGYDLADNLTALTYPNGKTVTYALDADERIHQLTDWLGHTTTFSYDPDSNLASTTFPDTAGTVDTSTYNNDDQISSITSAQGATTLISMTYTRTPLGQVQSESDTGLPGPASQSYTYNSLGQLASDSQTGSYTYDAADNPTGQHGSTYQYDAANETTHSGGSTYSYDNEGERTANNWTTTTMSYGYDQAGNLISVSQPAYGTTAAVNNTYTYNGDGLRQTLNQAGSQHTFTWNTNASLPELLAEGSTYYLYGPQGVPIEQIAGSSPNYFHQDQQRSLRLITNQAGASVEAYTYDPYGRLLASTGTGFSRLTYDSQFYESTSGLYYLRARSYDPKTAQFLTRDPLQQITQQPYSYATDDPVNLNDPSGRIAGTAAGCAVGEAFDPFGGCVPGALVGTATAGAVVVAGALWSLFSDDSEQANTNAESQPQPTGCDPSPSAAEGGSELALSSSESWGNPATLEDHFLRHGADFGATSAEDYASQASSFLQRGLRGGAEVKVDSRGVIRVYDPETNTFGAYNADGTTRTFYKPEPAAHGYPTNRAYWDAQPGSAP
jgi:RHS repeat-associated protein